jgi:hypothetical protein
MRKLQEQRARGVAAADRSPHAKAEYSASEFEELVKKFEQLSWRMVGLLIFAEIGALFCS